MVSKPKKRITNAEQIIQEPEENKKITETGQVGMTKAQEKAAGQITDILTKYGVLKPQPNEAIKKLKPNGLSIEQIDQKYYNLLDEHEIKKRDIINNYGLELEKEGNMPTDEVCKHVTEKLDGICSPQYVRECLDKKFKNQAMSKNASAGTPNRASTKKPRKNETEMRPQDNDTAMEEPKPEEEKPEQGGKESSSVSTFQAIIKEKSKTIHLQAEEIEGLRKQNKKLLEQLSQANKKVLQLEKELAGLKK